MPEIDRKKIAILRALDVHGEPLGSSRLAEELADLGVDLTDRAIRYQLQQFDEVGLTKSLGYVRPVWQHHCAREVLHKTSDVLHTHGIPTNLAIAKSR